MAEVSEHLLIFEKADIAEGQFKIILKLKLNEVRSLKISSKLSFL